ncbi:MAG: DUF167 domain-containing protein [Candidatus Nanoarchaeia archaeon]|nr:DUF167 domain-containing protein [Candidatus Nanoarchaeia archaeon]
MRIELKVRTGAYETKVTKEENGVVYLDVNAQPEENEANFEIIKFFHKKYKKPVSIVGGLKSRKKIIEIQD